MFNKFALDLSCICTSHSDENPSSTWKSLDISLRWKTRNKADKIHSSFLLGDWPLKPSGYSSSINAVVKLPNLNLLLPIIADKKGILWSIPSIENWSNDDSILLIAISLVSPQVHNFASIGS